MWALPFLSSKRFDKSFNLGLALIIVFAAAEICGASFYYLGRMRAAHAAAKPVPLPIAPPSAPALALAVASPPAAQVAPSPAATLSPSTSASSAADRLLKEATELRERGDTTNALARLQEASEKDPKNAQVLAEMATIYESIQLFDRSNETWRKVQEIGPSAGPVYELAETKLKTGVPVASATAPGLTVSPLDAGALRNDPSGIPTGSTLGITEVKATETPDPDADTNLLVRIGVKKRPNTVIDHTKVKIQVYFYDTVGENTQPVLTDADVSYEWLTPNHDWVDSDTELLAVTYLRPKNKALSSEAALAAAAAAVNPAKKGGPSTPSALQESGQRKYLGYIVRIYYTDKLQAVRANPTQLLNLFPAPFTAPSP